MGATKFRIVVVGGGPVGLIAAHILSQAGIDFVVLEKYGTVTPEPGNATAFWPQTVRVMDQLGILEHLKPLGTPLENRFISTHKGAMYSRSRLFGMTMDNHGYKIDIYHRHELLKAFYETLSEGDRAKILVNKDVISIDEQPASVTVRCADGTSYEGSMVLGADGVHSMVRRHIEGRDFRPWKSTFRILFGTIPRQPGLAPGDVYESHGPGMSVQLFNANARAWFFVYMALKSPTDEATRYSQADADDIAEALGDVHVTETLRIRDLYAQKKTFGVTNLEEGVAEKWHAGRVVLAGDAAHKMTPNIGWGLNSSVHDLVVLANSLRALLRSQDGGPIETEVLEDLFRRYQDEREAHVSTVMDITGKVTRLSAWESRVRWRRFLDWTLFPRIVADHLLVTFVVGPQVRVVTVLDWLEEKEFARGWIPWECAPKSGKEIQETNQVDGWLWWFLQLAIPAVIPLL